MKQSLNKSNVKAVIVAGLFVVVVYGALIYGLIALIAKSVGY